MFRFNKKMISITFEGGDGVKNPELFKNKSKVEYIDLTLSNFREVFNALLIILYK